MPSPSAEHSVWSHVGRTLRLSTQLALLLLVGGAERLNAQPVPPSPGDTVSTTPGSVPLRDVMDVAKSLIGRRVESQPQIKPLPGLSVALLPSVGYNPSYGSYVGISATIGGWLGDPANTSVTSGSAGASYSSTGQLSVQVKTDMFTAGNGMNFKGDWRYLDTSQSTYGLGPVAPGQSGYPMEFKLLRFYETAYRRLPSSSLYVGIGYHYNHYLDIRDERADAGEPTPFLAYSLGYPVRTTSAGISGNVLFDSRDNGINARSGAYWNASFRFFGPAFGGDASWQMLWSDLRAYPRQGRNTIGLWNYCWFTFGRAPYLDLSSIGWDTYGRSGRGYLQGRIRSADQIYNEVEYRRSLREDDLLGAVAFVNLTVSAIPESGAFGIPDVGGGVGIRAKFNKRTATNLTMDVAWGEGQGANVFFGMQEVF